MIVGTREREWHLDPSVATATGAVPDGRSSWGIACLNCGAPLGGDYCAACGQRALPPDPTIRELAGDAFSEFSGWDGKFVRTLKLLVMRPGELTHKFLIGQRIRFISPLRLYLTCSFVFFALTAASPKPAIVVQGGGITLSRGVSVGVTDAPSAESGLSPRMAAVLKALEVGLNNLDPATRAVAEKQLHRAPAFLRPIFLAIAIDRKAFQARVAEAMPRAFFVLIPGLAFTLALFYRRRHYPEHIYFAMHFQSFVFLALALNPLAEFTGVGPLIAIVRLLTTVGVIGYEVVALRRVYGGSTGQTIAKMVGMAAISGVIWMTMVIGVVYWSSRAYIGA